MGSRLGHAEAFPKRAKATQCLVPYSENKGYASNPRRFIVIIVYIFSDGALNLLFPTVHFKKVTVKDVCNKSLFIC